MASKALQTAGNLFSYTNRKCDCKITTTYDANGNEQHSILVKRMNSGGYLYAYAPVDGLVMLNTKTGSIIEQNKVIEDFLNIDLNDVNQIKCFIDKYGFFTALPENEYIEFNHVEVAVLLNRYRILVELMAAIEESSIDYSKVFHMVCILLFGRPRNMVIPSIGEEIQSCLHPFTQLWFDIDNVVEIDNLVNGMTDPPYDSFYPVEDTFTGVVEKLDYLQYNEEVGNMDDEFTGYSEGTKFRMNITYLYKNAFPVDLSARNAIDFFYHLIKEGTIIESCNEVGRVKTRSSITSNPKFKESFADKLILLAKQIIKEEFDYELFSIHPVYNIETMAPEWEMPNLFTALYFALFYTRPDYEIYRKCANPNCNRLFKVKTTNSRQLYHNTACQNAAAQMRHRKKKKN